MCSGRKQRLVALDVDVDIGVVELGDGVKAVGAAGEIGRGELDRNAEYCRQSAATSSESAATRTRSNWGQARAASKTQASSGLPAIRAGLCAAGGWTRGGRE